MQFNMRLALSDEEDDASLAVPIEVEALTTSIGLEDERLRQETNSEKIQLSERGSTNLGQTSTKASLSEGPHPLVGFRFASEATFPGSGAGATQTSAGSGAGATQTSAGLGSGTISFSEKTEADSAGQLNRKDLYMSVEMVKVSPVNGGSTGFLSGSSQSLLSITAKVTDVDSPLVTQVIFNGDSSKNAGLNAKVITATLAEKHVHLKEIVGLAPGYTCVHSTHHKQHPSKENYWTLLPSGMLNSEPKF
ncbi:hypothetical protein PanWU01x14_321950 [Parasponia andersonii]|uniref:Uncharacterized protein n=1 Tax=Parasponia andersonii TaxID=3476 RepID=A0A2P5AL01_PARAD|nr:hypothetical protein PanWU01x14_321950 [Parasponia andersonii]